MFTLADEQIALLLRHLWATDGSVTLRKPGAKGGPRVYFATASAALANVPLDLLNQARDGVLFLHDCCELTRVEQKGLLLLLAKMERYNARLVSGATCDLPELVAQGSFDARLYAALRELDTAGVDAIFALGIRDDEGLAAALRDRLHRAAAGRIIHT